MRITNNIMINNSLSSINDNKVRKDTLNTQINTTKKIQRPSEDPIIAIRALRLRSTANEIEQYLERNIPDAESWMTSTKDALTSMNKVLEDIIYYCNQGVNEYETVEERQAVIASLKQYREAVYQDGNADDSGRTIFTGYKTDTSLTFMKDDADVSYNIKEKFNFSDVKNLKRVVGVKESDISSLTAPNPLTNTYVGTDIMNNSLNVLKLGYTDISASSPVTIESADPDINGAPVIIKSKELNGDKVYNVSDNEIVFVPETGEMIFGKNYYDRMTDADFSINYTKKGFKEGDLRPEHYFECDMMEQTGVDGSGNPVYKTTSYADTDQKINYTISFNQTITINTQAKKVLNHGVGRDIDEMIQALEAASFVQDKIAKIETKIKNTTDEAQLLKLNALKSAAELELGYAENNLTESFSKGITNYQKHQQTVSVELSDLASRIKRVDLVSERLGEQKISVDNLKSTNEDTNLTDAAVQFKAASAVYDASLAAAAKVVQKTLLDFL